MNQDNPFAKGISHNEDWVGEEEKACETCKKQFTPIDKMNYHCRVCQPITDRAGLAITTPEE